MWKEFKEFALGRNFMDMAVGIIIGSAVSAVVTGLIDGLISPIIGALTAGVNLKDLAVNLMGVELKYGLFLDALIKFIIIALVVFLMIRFLEKAKNYGKKPVEEAVTTKVCPFCKSEIDINATRCPHCTSELSVEKDPAL
ncbi:MAG: large conductance mechanosensitive channel protein MscL [Finegoldia sp.]|nr:large conductance mechanosensitive channel protein MscL [Finegoldia sp.]